MASAEAAEAGPTLSIIPCSFALPLPLLLLLLLLLALVFELVFAFVAPFELVFALLLLGEPVQHYFHKQLNLIDLFFFRKNEEKERIP